MRARRDGAGTSGSRTRLIVIWGVLAVIVTAVVGTAMARRIVDGTVAAWQALLAAQCSEQAEAIAAWVERNRTEATLIAAFPTVRYLAGIELEGSAPFPAERGPHSHLHTILEPLTRRRETIAAVVVGGAGETVFAAGAAIDVEGGWIAGPVRDHGIELRQMRDGTAVAVTRVAVVGSQGRPVGEVVLVVDPSEWLFPFLERRPMRARTGSSCLVAVDGPDVVVLSRLRRSRAVPLGLRLDADTPGLSAARGRPSGTVGRFRDERGVEVFSAMRSIEGTDWRLLTEVDRAEVLSEARHRAVIEIGLLVAVVAVLGLAGVLAWSIRHRQHRREVERFEADARRIVDTTHEGVMVLDLSGRVVFANRRVGEIVGRPVDSLIGHAVTDLVSEADRDGAERRLGRRRTGVHETYELAFDLPDGGRRVMLVNAAPMHDDDGRVTGVLAMMSDVTELRSTEDELRQAQKLEAIGRLAGGVAHDFNNLLQAMLGTVQLLRMKVADSPDLTSRLDELAQHVERGAEVTRQLLLFARRDGSGRACLDLCEVLVRMESLLRRLLPETVELRTEVEEGPLPVLADPIQLEQVVMNLVVNAADAMPEGGRLTISTGNDGGHVWLRVADTGCGVPDDVAEKIFEAFFTTKERGVGTGLGLSVVARIVRDHGGDVVLEETRRGGGSTFLVRLPAAADSGPPEGRRGLGASVGDLPRGDGELVLVVEDEAVTREGLGILLGELGYRVTLAGTGAEAVAAVEIAAPDVLASDQVLPDTTGERLASELRSRLPELAVVLLSGYDETEELRRRQEAGELRFIQKPVGVERLAAEVRAALDQARERG